MKTIKKQILIEKSIDEVWRAFETNESILKILYPNIIEIKEITRTENIIGSKWSQIVSYGNKTFAGEIEIIKYRNEGFWKELGRRSFVEKKFETITNYELTVFEGDRSKTLVVVEVQINPLNNIDKLITLADIKAAEKVSQHLEKIKGMVLL